VFADVFGLGIFGVKVGKVRVVLPGSEFGEGFEGVAVSGGAEGAGGVGEVAGVVEPGVGLAFAEAFVDGEVGDGGGVDVEAAVEDVAAGSVGFVFAGSGPVFAGAVGVAVGPACGLEDFVPGDALGVVVEGGQAGAAGEWCWGGGGLELDCGRAGLVEGVGEDFVEQVAVFAGDLGDGVGSAALEDVGGAWFVAGASGGGPNDDEAAFAAGFGDDFGAVVGEFGVAEGGAVGDADDGVEAAAGADFGEAVEDAAEEVAGADFVVFAGLVDDVVEASGEVAGGSFYFEHFCVAGGLAHDEADAGVAAGVQPVLELGPVGALGLVFLPLAEGSFAAVFVAGDDAEASVEPEAGCGEEWAGRVRHGQLIAPCR
jgi:hypothetical protein